MGAEKERNDELRYRGGGDCTVDKKGDGGGNEQSMASRKATIKQCANKQ